jgi:hypothetical protein
MHNCENLNLRGSLYNSKKTDQLLSEPSLFDNQTPKNHEVKFDTATTFVNEYYNRNTTNQKINNKNVNIYYPPRSSSQGHKPRGKIDQGPTANPPTANQGLLAIEGDHKYHPTDYISMQGKTDGSTLGQTHGTGLSEDQSKKVYPGGFRYHDVGNYDPNEDTGYSIMVKKRWRYTHDVQIPIWESLYRDGIRRTGQPRRAKSSAKR